MGPWRASARLGGGPSSSMSGSASSLDPLPAQGALGGGAVLRCGWGYSGQPGGRGHLPAGDVIGQTHPGKKRL